LPKVVGLFVTSLEDLAIRYLVPIDEMCLP
jgi:hypothetical protein